MGSMAMKYMTLAAGATTTGGPIWLHPDNISNISFTTKTGGTLTGTFTVEASPDLRARQASGDTANAEWTDITATMTGVTNPAGATTEAVATRTGVPYALVRLIYTHTSGAGAVDVWFSGQSS